MGYTPKCKTKTIKQLEENTEKSLRTYMRQWALRCDTKAWSIKDYR